MDTPEGGIYTLPPLHSMTDIVQLEVLVNSPVPEEGLQEEEEEKEEETHSQDIQPGELLPTPTHPI